MTAVVTRLDAFAARRLTDEVKTDAASLWTKLLALYEQDAHTALGYASWQTYFEAEFGQTGARGYQLLDAGRVYRAVFPRSTMVDSVPNERQARELAPLLDQGDEVVAKAWTEAIVEYGEDVTASKIHEVVVRYIPESDLPKSLSNGHEGQSAGQVRDYDDRKYIQPSPEAAALLFKYEELLALLQRKALHIPEHLFHAPSYNAGQLAVAEQIVADLKGNA